MELGYAAVGVAAEAKLPDGIVVSSDLVFDRVKGLMRIW